MVENDKAKEELKLMIILFKTYQTLTNFIKEDISGNGFNLNEFAVLEVIYHKGSVSVSEIFEKVLVANSSLTYILDKLVKKSLIQRNQDLEDKRVTHISLTDHGEVVAKNIFPQHYKNLTEVFNVLSAEEKLTASNILKKLSLSAGDSK